MINRVKQIITAPKDEWAVIEGENTPHVKLFTGYILPLSLIPAIAAFIGYGLIGYTVFGIRVNSIDWGVRQAIVHWITMVCGIYVTAFIVDLLAGNFGAQKNFDKAFSLVAYSYTPMLVAGIFYILPSLSWLASLAGLYGLYLLYIGLQPLMKVPADKNLGYFVTCIVVTIIVSFALTAILGAILLSSRAFHLF